MLTKEQLKNRHTLITALRSGTYAQDTGYLRTPEGFCCQGVACDLFKDRVGGEWVPQTGFWGFSIPGVPKNDSSFDILWSNGIRNLVGVDDLTSSQLVNMNDGNSSRHKTTDHYTIDERCTFDEIADCLEYLTLGGL